MLLSPNGIGDALERTGELFSSHSARLPSIDPERDVDFKKLGFRRLARGRRGAPARRDPRVNDPLRLALSSVFSSSQSLSDPFRV